MHPTHIAEDLGFSRKLLVRLMADVWTGKAAEEVGRHGHSSRVGLKHMW